MSSGRCDYVKYWEEKGAQKNFSTPFQIDIFKEKVACNADILDVGCGYGRIMSSLHEAGYENIKGVEPSARLRSRGMDLDSSLDIRPLDGCTIPFQDNSFDAVLLVAVLTCIPKNKDQSCLIKEIHRILKSGGILYVNDFLLNTDQRNLDRYKLFQPKHDIYGIFELDGGGVLRHFSEEHINKLLSPFTSVEYKKVTYTTMNGNKSNGFYYIGSR
ncbi:class I SAM-dependent methyltransferase [Maridesulfovibrio hydrothermalis]|uniref:Predicted methyltransferase n=1 Tax=Maridesulfovibrio hydrothermalis AM13 = DSM 14728 TaxID=1121451 RepID=L0RIB1_9BACT|nr:class I SAM-dependent methyltransferase [Maridesulfovibrio hydrothermalis]CCO25346.1 Predicted methyltransferase [Maridesulfovibrio hydrothermalis AM13 = DSM 14728]